MSPNNGILLNGILRPKLLNDPFPTCSFIHLDFLLPHTTHFGDNVHLPFSVFLLHFKQYVNMFYNG